MCAGCALCERAPVCPGPVLRVFSENCVRRVPGTGIAWVCYGLDAGGAAGVWPLGGEDRVLR